MKKIDSHYGFRFQELQTHSEIKIIQERMKAVVQLRNGENSKNHYLGTGFFLFEDPPTLLTAYHVVEEYVKGSNFKKGVYFRLNYNDHLFEETEANTYSFDSQDKIYLNEKEDFAVIILSKKPIDEIKFLSNNICYNLSPLFPACFDPELFSSYQLESNLSIIHHPAEKTKKIATANKNYRVVHVNWNDLLELGFIERNDEIIARLRTRQRFVYWALDQESSTPFVRCTDHGSSGSPIFNNQWKLIGMHIQGSRVKTRNGRVKYCVYGVGVPILIIIDQLQRIIKNTRNNLT